MTRIQFKCLLAVFASDRKIKPRDGQLDEFVGFGFPIGGRVDEVLADFEEFVTGKSKFRAELRAERKRAREVERALRGICAARRARPVRPRMTKKLARECVAAGRDWATDAKADGRLHETDGQTEAMDIGACLAPHPMLAEACADYVYDGICKVVG